MSWRYLGILVASWRYPGILVASWLRPDGFKASWRRLGFVLATSWRFPGILVGSRHPGGIQASWWRPGCVLMVSRRPRVVLAASWLHLGHGLRTPREEIAFTARPKIQSQSEIFRYGRSIFCLPHRPNFSDIFDLCLHWVSVVCGVGGFQASWWAQGVLGASMHPGSILAASRQPGGVLLCSRRPGGFPGGLAWQPHVWFSF